MKKSLAVIVGTVMLLSTIVISAANVSVMGEGHQQDAPNASTLIFEDDFDTGNLNKWGLSGWNPSGVCEVTTAQSHSSPYSLHCQSDPGTDTGPYVKKGFGQTYDHIKAENWIYLPTKTQAYDQIALLRLSAYYGYGNENNYHLGITLRDDDYKIDVREDLFFPNGQYQHLMRAWDLVDLAPNTWHQLILEIDNDVFTVQVNGVTVMTDIRNDIDSINYMFMGDTKGISGGWGDAYWDDVKVWVITQPQQTVDLSINDQDIAFSNPNPTQGDPVTIEATVHGDLDVPGGWQKYGVVLNVGGPGENLHVVNPSILKMSNGSYAMWYSGTDIPYGYSIFRAWSLDGITWHKQGAVLQKGGAYQETGVYTPYVYVHNGIYHMWYGGLFQSGGNRACIQYATSTDDGFTWQKQGMELYHEDGVSNPYVTYEGGQWRMWYTGIYWGNPNQCRIHHAHKVNLQDPWIKDGVVLNNNGPYDYPSAAAPKVFPTATGYEMYYTGYTPYTGPARILHATSPDGFNWIKDGIALNGTMPEENNYVAYADLMTEGNTLKCWYSGYDFSNWRIFYAEKVPANPGLDATCTVSFYLDSIDPGNLIHQEFNVFVPGGGQTTVSANWIPTIVGNHTIIVTVTDVNPPDSDMTNNYACSQIFVQEAANNATATATGPQGAHHDPIITLTYDWTDVPDAVDLFYSTNNGDGWHYIATDYSVDGYFDWEPQANPGPKPSKYWWIANARNGADDVGIPANGTAPEAGPFNWKTWDVCNNAPRTLLPGGQWFFVSFPLDISGNVAEVFDDAEWGDGGTMWDYIQWFETSTCKWRSYSIHRPPALNDLMFVDNTMGFWIHLTSNDGDGALTVGEGNMPVSTTIQLHTGWNLVGYPTTTPMDAETALWGTGFDMIMIFDPGAPYRVTEVPLTHIMYPDNAYWIHVPFDTVWTIDW